MSRTQEGRRQQHGFVTRTVEVPAELDRRLVHHARRSGPLEVIVRNALVREVARLDVAERVASAHGNGDADGPR